MSSENKQTHVKIEDPDEDGFQRVTRVIKTKAKAPELDCPDHMKDGCSKPDCKQVHRALCSLFAAGQCQDTKCWYVHRKQQDSKFCALHLQEGGCNSQTCKLEHPKLCACSDNKCKSQHRAPQTKLCSDCGQVKLLVNGKFNRCQGCWRGGKRMCSTAKCGNAALPKLSFCSVKCRDSRAPQELIRHPCRGCQREFTVSSVFHVQNGWTCSMCRA
jgi:hypothetical protein